MRTITITEETFDKLFDEIENDFAYDSPYMDRGESSSDFQLGIPCLILKNIRRSINHLKNELARLE